MLTVVFLSPLLLLPSPLDASALFFSCCLFVLQIVIRDQVYEMHTYRLDEKEMNTLGAFYLPGKGRRREKRGRLIVSSRRRRRKK